MKLFAFISAIVLLILSCMPCMDNAALNKGSHAATELPENHDHDADHRDNCSPLCICACCTTSTCYLVANPITPDLPVLHYMARNYSLFYTGETQDIPLPIWQPPQLMS